MSQHDFDLATADANTGPTVRAGMNAMAQALASNNSGATEPATKYANMWWADTTADMLKQRNAANTAWINKGKLSDIAYGAGALQAQAHIAFTPGGTVNAITGTLTPAVTENTNNLRVFFTPTGSNTITNPTLNIGGGAVVIKKKDLSGVGLVALLAGDMNQSSPMELIYSTAGACWVLINPGLSHYGFGQTPQSFLGSRVAGTTYYNTTGKVIVVSVTCTSTVSNSTPQITTGGVIFTGTATYGAGVQTSVQAPILPGGSYIFGLSSGTPTITVWTELR